MKKKNKKILLALILILIILISILTLMQEKKKTSKIANTTEISNKKIGWGILRNDKHEQPDLGAKNQKILEENQGIAIGDKEEKRIYLTFDEGYEAGYTPEILEKLKENNVTATFFITAHYLNTQPELVEQMIKEKHIVR